MNKDKKIDQEVKKTLESLDGLERVSTDSFFYSRLTARLENRELTNSKKQESLDFGFAFSVAAVFIVLVLNLISISQYNFTFTETEPNRNEVVQELADEYQVFELNYYEMFEEE